MVKKLLTPSDYYVGAPDVKPGDQHVWKWVATDNILPDNSDLWGGDGAPQDDSRDYVTVWETDGKFYSHLSSTEHLYICEDTSTAPTTSTDVQCALGFTQILGGCFYVDNTNRKN